VSLPEGLEARLRGLVVRLGLQPDQEQRLRTLVHETGSLDPLVSVDDAPGSASAVDPEATATDDLGAGAVPPPPAVTGLRPQPMVPQEGALIGPYRVLARLGSGGMGDVLRVMDADLRRPMALKILHTRRSTNEAARLRFLAEARATARLQHPGIVPIHALGELPDGRLWYTMEEVRGRTLRQVILDLHAASQEAGRWVETTTGWTLRRVVDALHRATQAIAYAHTRGVVHRDIKPANIMVGEFGEVRVLDWGVARILEQTDDVGGMELLLTNAPSLTRAGTAVGTPLYMAPEQARGEQAVGPASDVYALGVTLFQVLEGRPPDWAAGFRLLQKDALVPPRAPEGPGRIPDELVEIMLRATREDPVQRYADGAAMAAALGAWLDGARRRDRALALVARADALRPRIHQQREQARGQDAAAREMLEHLPPYAPVDSKRAAWTLEDDARALSRAAAEGEVELLQLLRQALEESPDLDEARDRLADLYRARHAEAEAKGQAERAAEAEAQLRRFGARRHAAYLRGEGALTLLTEPPGARVSIYRYEEQDRRLVPRRVAEHGPTPLFELPLDPGSYLCEIEAEGHEPVQYPVHIRRREHWDGVPPGGHGPVAVLLPEAGSLGPDDVYVPAGWFWSGERTASKDASLPWRRLWLDAFVIRRFPVTNAEYIAFLDDLVATGRQADADACVPRYKGSVDAPGAAIYGRRPDGGYCLVPDADGDLWQPDWPVFMVTVAGAEAFAAWHAARTGQHWRLPGELQWEKAARGVDGRIYPWGDHPEPTYANARDSQPDVARPQPVGVVPTDRSPYGVRDLSGGVCELCAGAWSPVGPPVSSTGRVLPVPPGGDLRAGRGGAWSWHHALCRLDFRSQHKQGGPRHDTSFRLLRALLGG